MTEQLSSFQRKRGRRVFDAYSGINSFSFALVTGNTITLYALALGASSTVVGLLGAFMYVSFFAIPLGKLMVRGSTLVRTFAHNWMLRNWSLLPLLLIPFLAAAGYQQLAIGVLLLSVLLFNLFRGIGLIANNPVIGLLAPGKDRGEYIVRLSLINNSTALIATLFLAFLLWHNSGVETYNLVVLIGITAGIGASALLYKLPDPGAAVSASAKPASAKSAGSRFSAMFRDLFSQRGRADAADANLGADGPARPASLLAETREAWKDQNFRRFVLSYLVLGVGIGMVRPFIVVYGKAVYGQSDSMVTIFSVCASLGALLMGAVMRVVIDRLGAKPMYIIFAAVSALSLVPAVLAPGIGHPVFALAFLCLLSAAVNMGFAGQESAAQTYFFAMVPKESILNLSMLYYFILGGTGALGSIAGGAILDALTGAGASALTAWRLFFVGAGAVIGLGCLAQRNLLDLGSFPVRDTLAVLFSPRDMRALTLLRKLDVNEDPDEETGIIAELGAVGSEVSADMLLDRLASARFAVRYEALQSVSRLKRLNGRLREALLAELVGGAYTTAPLAARLLGDFRVHQAVPLLRERLTSPDYRLAGESMYALARIGDTKSQTAIGEALSATDNPFILVRGVQAIAEYGTPASIPILLGLLRNENLPPHVADETILTLSAFMGMPKKFFYSYEEWTRNRDLAAHLLEDYMDECFARRKLVDPELAEILRAFMTDPGKDADFDAWIMRFHRGKTGVLTALLLGVALDAEILRQDSFRFFLCFWALAIYANPALIEI